MAPKFLAWENLRRDFATFTKHPPHENVTPRSWPDHPTVSCSRATGINIRILCPFARARSAHAATANSASSRARPCKPATISFSLFDSIIDTSAPSSDTACATSVISTSPAETFTVDEVGKRSRQRTRLARRELWCADLSLVE